MPLLDLDYAQTACFKVQRNRENTKKLVSEPVRSVAISIFTTDFKYVLQYLT